MHRYTSVLGAVFLIFSAMLLSQSVSAQVAVSVPAASLPTVETYPQCVPNAQSGYKSKQCLVIVDRQAPISPPTLIVPVGTTVFVELVNTRWNENVTFTLSTTHTTTQDVAAGAIKNAIPGLQTIVFDVTATPRAVMSVSPTGILGLQKAVSSQQEDLAQRLNVAIKSIQNSNAGLTCLSSYQVLQPDHTCSQASLLTPATFVAAKDAAIAAAQASANLAVPVLDVTDFDALVKTFYLTCLAYVPGMPPKDQDVARQLCRDMGEKVSSKESLIDSALSDIQKAQDALLQVVNTLEAWPGAPFKVAYQFTTTKNNNMSVAIAGVEIVSKTSSPVATVAINPQASRWVVSMGLAGSNLTYHTYTNAPIIVNGQPVLNSSGQTTTVVTRMSTSPSFIAPEALLSYNLIPSSHTRLFNKCDNGCAILATVGVGANLTSKTADFDAGLSFRIGGVLLTPALHFGRDTRLTNGVEVGQKLGSSPPNPLPTTNAWVRKFALGITYTIPTP
jgi:hypothetical protein